MLSNQINIGFSDIERENKLIEGANSIFDYLGIALLIILFPVTLILLALKYYAERKLLGLFESIDKHLTELQKDDSIFRKMSYTDAKIIMSHLDKVLNGYEKRFTNEISNNNSHLEETHDRLVSVMDKLKVMRDLFHGKMVCKDSPFKIIMSKDDKDFLNDFFGEDKLYEEDTYIQNTK